MAIDKGVVLAESVQSMFDKHLDKSFTRRGACQPFTNVARSDSSPPVMPMLGTDTHSGTEKTTTGIAQPWNAHWVKRGETAQRFGPKNSNEVAAALPDARGCE
jgi:hypothetical protein